MLVLTVVVALEFLAVAAITVVLLVDLLVAPPAVLVNGLALIVLAAIAALWLGAMVVGLLRGRPWVRSGIIVWQILQIAIAVGAFQGVFREPAIGWALLAPALVALALVFSKSVTTLLARPDAH
ncbi:hypothetical protein [Curtobacterium sp. Leaf261]|uniref:hypothetical protein n=1 Tax=Curtobacterium sp. Leaf261 TaxID=1736311 RepID=UPI000700B355|nr:hypothetical protein [Curtobacterium sp. Leaf261]KQO62134.1 hypothetical protein ASF23_09870 [Curtobacterium sp. Leaf261]